MPLYHQWKNRCRNLKIFCISETDILYALSNINSSKACGPDLVSSGVLKEAAKELSMSLSNFFNQSIQTSYF